MVVATGVMDNIVILDDDEEENPLPCSSTSSSSTPVNKILNASRPTLAPTHITQSPFASSKTDSHILQLENQRLFAEFLEHCANHTQDCPEVMTFLRAKHTKASPEFLGSVEFRNTLGRCLTRAQSGRTKTFVYINELCTVLKQHAAKKRQAVVTLEPSGPEPGGPEPGDQAEPSEEQPSTSGQEEKKKKAPKASRRQIAYLENLLKVYYEEIRRLQEKELSLDEMMEEDSGYIQEHKLKRKMMKIYDKLCELKGCNTLTGRVIEQRVRYSGTRYPEINRKIERFINSPESRSSPPDYTDILQLVQRTNERYNLSLSRKQLTQIAQDAFRETGNRLQERRHLDMVYNFGSHLTDCYKPAGDPALADPTLARKLRSNREVALTSLDEVITKYALKQDDTEEDERKKRQERDRVRKETLAAQNESKKTEEAKEGKEEKEESEEEGGESEGDEQGEDEGEEDEEDEVSSDPDIEEELQASQSQGADDEEEDEEEDQANLSEEDERWASGGSSGSDREAGTEENGEGDNQSASSCQGEAAAESPSVKSNMKEDPTPSASPSQSGATVSPEADASSNSNHAMGEPVSSNHMSADQQSPDRGANSPSSCKGTKDQSCPSPFTANRHSPSPSPTLDSFSLVSLPRTANSSAIPLALLMTEMGANPEPIAGFRKRKRKRTREASPKAAFNGSHKRDSSSSDSDIPLDMGVVTSSPLPADSTRADTPSQEPVSSSECTPPPKKNKVNVWTQCDPDEVIILSDSD
ncbi:death domain-associated protein 6 [Megalops cyprinoides]|uniref:death domain-associated protein 6 n=1 Tax=Megalops cyprinoides TaxID=118141 RepID=UPI001864EC48|nr:death domain-associated protein 6 [Megalops cyprinoides]